MQFFKHFFVYSAAFHKHQRLAVNVPPQPGKLFADERGRHLQSAERQHRDEPVQQRDIAVRHRDRRDLRDHHRRHEFGQLQLAYLPLPHKPHHRGQRYIKNKRAQKNHSQKHHPRLFLPPPRPRIRRARLFNACRKADAS